MKEYKRVINEIHAPEDLIERTKASVREEEKRVERSRRKLTAVRRNVAVIAAVVVTVLIAVPAVRFGILKNINTDRAGNTQPEANWQEQKDTQITFGKENTEPKPEKIGKEQLIIMQGNLVDEYQEVTFKENWEIEGIKVSVYDIKAEQTGKNNKVSIGIAAEFHMAGVSYYVVDEKGDKDFLFDEIERYISSAVE